MLLLKLLGFIDGLSAIVFLTLAFGIQPFTPLILFCSGLLFLKSLFILSGDVLSLVDLYAAIALLISIFFELGAIFVWIPTFLLLAKALVSFL